MLANFVSVVEYTNTMKQILGEDSPKVQTIIANQVGNLRRSIPAEKPHLDEARRVIAMLSDSPFSAHQRNEVIDLIDKAIEHASGNMTKGDGKSQANPFFFNYLTDTDWRSLAADVPMATKMKLMVSICLDRLGMLYPNEETDNIILAAIVLATKSEPQPQQWYRWLQDWKSVKSADRKTLPDKTLLMRSV